jgi:hypothetical protein
MLPAIMLMDAIPVMQFEGLLTRDDLSADRTTSWLLLQELCTQCRGRLQGQLSLSLLKVRLPVGVAWIGLAFDLHRTLGVDRCLYAGELFAGRRIGQAPGCPRLMGNIALGDPASRFVRMAEFGPSRESSPDETVEMCTRRTTDAVPMIVGPSSEERVQRIDEVGRGGPGGVATERFALDRAGLYTGLAGCNLARGRFAVGADMLTDRLP